MNWDASSGNRWTVPFGGGAGKIFAIGKQKMNAQVAAYWNAVKPEALDGSKTYRIHLPPKGPHRHRRLWRNGNHHRSSAD